MEFAMSCIDKVQVAEFGYGFGPDAVSTMALAFNEAWEEIGRAFIGSEPNVIEDARNALAHAVIKAARNGNLDVSSMKRAAIFRVKWQFIKPV
jgi:hypothetical protein